MVSAEDLARAAAGALVHARGEPGVLEAEVFAVASRTLLARLHYTSAIPCNGLEEPKSSETCGLGVQLVLASPDAPCVGFGSEPGDLGPAGAARAVAKARRAAVADPEFRSLPRPIGNGWADGVRHDPALMSLDDEGLVDAGWQTLTAGLRTFLDSPRLAELAGGEAGLARLGLVLGGDVTILQERVALASTRLGGPRVDETARVAASVTAMVEALDAKGSATALATRLADLGDEAGTEAVQGAIDAVGGERVPSGDYTIVFGPHAVADLLDNLVLPACMAPAFYASNTPFLGKLGRPVASPLLSIHDDGGGRGLAASRAMTCEGLPTGRTDLIREGMLAGVLSSWYETQRLLGDPELAAKLGAAGAEAARALIPRNGFRLGGGGARQFDTPPSVAASNVVVEGRAPLAPAELLAAVGEGLYVGRIWYTYPINSLRRGDFTCTVVADSFVIRGGRPVAPIRANTLRINDNITGLLARVVAVGRVGRATQVWGADEVVYTPEIAVSGVHVDEIAGFMEDLP